MDRGRGKIKASAFFDPAGSASQMQQDLAGQDIAEFLSFVGGIRSGASAGFQQEPDRFHGVFLRTGDDPGNLVVSLGILFERVIFRAEGDL